MKTLQGKFLVIALILTFAISIKADLSEKTFEIGAGTTYTTSNKRNFYLSCLTTYGVTVKYKRLGQAGSANDIRIVIEVRHPGPDPDTEGEIVKSAEVSATTTLQTVGWVAPKATRGCSNPWVVRVRSKSGETPPVAVSGNIVFAWNGTESLSVQDAGNINLDSSNTVTVKIGSADGLPQGKVTVTGEWFHNLGVMPIRMRFELINPNGTVVATDYGYSKNEVNPCCSGNKLRLVYSVNACIPGQWKLRIKNVSDGHDAIRVRPIAEKLSKCN